jgi:hypothetical protein
LVFDWSIRMRKRLIDAVNSEPRRQGEIDCTTSATVAITSENPNHPVEVIFDGVRGPGGKTWMSARPNVTEQIIVEFDEPHSLKRIEYEVEEHDLERTQKILLEASQDRGTTYRQLLVQDFTFSPGGATFQREQIQVDVPGATHVRITVVPNLAGSGHASLSSLRLFE